MIFFLVGLLLLVALALLFVLPPLLRAQAPAGSDTAADAARRANLQVLREQLRALDAEFAAGRLDAVQHQAARSEIERRALEEEQAAAAPARAGRAGKTAIALGLFVPLSAFVLYGLLGAPAALLPQPPVAADAGAGQGGVTQAQVEDMVARLAARLEGQATPQKGDEQAWAMLGRSYAVLQRYPEASKAFARARQLSPADAQLLADHADVLAMLQGQRVQGEPAALAARALEIEPDNVKALALLGSAAFEARDFDAALKYWSHARRFAEPGSQFAAGLDGGIQQARANGGRDAAGAAVAASSAPAPAGAGIGGTVQLAGALAAQARPGDTLFVFARAAQGPRMPLAIVRMRVSDLPLKFSLDDGMAMSSELRLSAFPSVIVGARISRSGDAMPRSGDLVGQVGPVALGSRDLVITIDGVQP